MPYTPPSTVTGSDVLTAALWNTQIRDNFEWLRKPPAAHVIRTTAWTATTGTAIPWEQALFDTNPTSWTVSSPTQLTINTDGIYLVSASIEGTNTIAFATPPSISIYRAGGAYSIARELTNPQGSTAWQGRITLPVRLYATDTLTCRVDYSGGGVVTVRGAGTSPAPEISNQSRFSITWLGEVV